jgi:hypothetical protein
MRRLTPIVGRKSSVISEDKSKNYDFLLSCLIQISIEKSRDDMYTYYEKYWKDKYKTLEINEIVRRIKIDFNYIDEESKKQVKTIIQNENK